MKNSILALAALSLLPITAKANKNFECYGVADLFGLAKESAKFDRSEGRINIPSFFRGNSSVSFQENEFSYRLGPQPVPALGGGSRLANMESKVGFEYEGDRLVGTTQSTYEIGRSEEVHFGGTMKFDWPGGKCRLTQITVKNKAVMGNASGVLFDARLCEVLKKNGFDPAKGGDCAADAKAMRDVILKFDSELRAASKEAQVLVTPQPLLREGFMLVNQFIDSSFTLQTMANCAQFARSGNSSKAAKRPSLDPLKKVQSAK